MDFIEAVKNAGIVGQGGAGFPTAVKLKAKAEYFIVNAAECEPMIETDKFLCRTYPERLVTTVAKIKEHLGATTACIAIKNHYHREIAILEKALETTGADVKIFKMKTFYPAGDEQSMVQQVTGRCVPERGLPLDVGCVVDNVGTVLAVADALEGRPVQDKFLSVTGDVQKAMVYRVPLGTPIRDVLAQAPLNLKSYAIIMGGPMMGKMLATDEQIDAAVVTKTTGNLLVIPKDHYLVTRATMEIPKMIHQARSACIQCRFCTDLCPRHLIGHNVRPNMVMRNVWQEQDITDNDTYVKIFGSAMNCCSCGACELFACPMGLSPRKMNDYIKTKFRERGIQVDRNMNPVALPDVDIHKIPTEKLIGRLGLTRYIKTELPEFAEFTPDEVFLPFSQHIGKPAEPVVAVGDKVEAGTMIAKAAENALSVNIYTGFAGTVTEVTGTGVRISRKEG